MSASRQFSLGTDGGACSVETSVFSLHTPHQKVVEGLGREQPLNGRMGDEEGEEAPAHFSDLATFPLMTQHRPLRT